MVINIDYEKSYIKYLTPISVRGETNNKSLKQFKNKLLLNASSVKSDLGDCDHGYLGLVLMAVVYTCVSSTPFSRQINPVFIFPTRLTAIEATLLRDQHIESVRLYCECKNVEKTLTRYI